LQSSRRSGLIARGCLVTLFLIFLVLPVAGFALAVWLLLTPSSSEVVAATAYKSAPVCTSSPAQHGCLQTERAHVLSYSWIPGRCGSHTDRFTLQLTDGVHQADVHFDCLGANPSYASADGLVAVREYRGLVTTVFDVSGKAYETTDSPTHGGSWTRGLGAVMLAVFGTWLLLLVVAAIYFRFGNRPVKPVAV
jgi:hypothetical protein